MEFQTVFMGILKCVCLLLVLYYEIANGIGVWPNFIRLSCEINITIPDSDIFINCAIKVTSFYFERNDDSVRPNFCRKYPTSLLFTPHQNSFETVSCVSNRPILLKIETESEFVKEEYLKTQWSRTFSDFFEPKTYYYKLRVIPHRHSMAKEVVKYTFFARGSPTTNVQILRFQHVQSEKQIDVNTNVAVLGGMLKKAMVAKDAVITIPCLFHQPETASLYRSNGIVDQDHIAIAVDNSSLLYIPTEGFKLNTNLFSNWTGTYYCGDSQQTFKTKPFNLTGVDPAFWSTEFAHLANHPFNLELPYYSRLREDENYTFIPHHRKAQFQLTCVTTSSNVTFEAQISNAFQYDFAFENFALNITYFKKENPENRNTALVSVSGVHGKMIVNCLDPSDRNFFHTWRLGNYDDGEQRNLTVTPNEWSDIISCKSDLRVGYGDKVDFRQIQCNDRFSCKTLAPAIFEPSAKITKIQVATDCYPNNEECICKSLRPYMKGFFSCSVFVDQLKILTYQDIYFLGFDNKIYIGDEKEPLDSAILKVEMIKQGLSGDILWLPGNFKFSCEAHSFYFENGITWLLEYQNGTQLVAPSENITNHPPITAHISQWKYPNVQVNSSFHLEDNFVARIICAAPLQSIINKNNSFKWKYMSVNVNLQNSIPPKIARSSEDLKIKYFRVTEFDQILKCQVEDGLPIPEISWTINGTKIEPPLVETGGVNHKLLRFPVYNDSFAGEYTCTARNIAGYEEEIFLVQTYVDTPPSLNIWSILAIFLFVCIIIIIPTAIFIIRHLRSQMRDQLTDNEIKEFLEGMPSEEDDDNVCPLSLPYNESYELAKEEFKIDTKNVLGRGAFGIVYRGTINKNDYATNAAFKTTKPYCGVEKIKSLLSELKIMIYVGKHENVILLLGAYTKEIKNGSVYIATELCSLGSLQDYLRSMDENNVTVPKRKKSSIRSNISLKSNNSVEVKVNLPRKVLKEKLYKWSSQIAKGMDYLASKYVVHSDLATRNILLDSNETVKITDFGLSRQMYNYYNYVKEKGKSDPLPWKWMAVETLRTLTFSTYSDVWAYGITVWEIFSLGAVPYPGISWSPEFREMLENGTRNPKPKLADSNVYNIMISCWDIDPRERPTFHNLQAFFQNLAIQKTNVIVVPTQAQDVYVEWKMETAL